MTDTRVRDTIDFFDILCRRSARPYRLVMGASRRVERVQELGPGVPGKYHGHKMRTFST